MKKIVGYAKLMPFLQEENPQFILCHGTGTGRFVHLAEKGARKPICGRSIGSGWNVNRKEVMYFNGGLVLERFCPDCFKNRRHLLEELAEERPDA